MFVAKRLSDQDCSLQKGKGLSSKCVQQENMKSSSCIFPLLIFCTNISCVMSWCHPDKRTDNPHGRCCVFPFVYGGKKYNSCTRVAHHRFWCSLDKVYKGHWANCVNPCTNNPCQNGGLCTVTGDDSYSCKCNEGYYGNNCEKGNSCTNNPCQNGGVCTVTGDDSYSCKCAAGYFGNNCEKVSPCKSLPCKNGGTCTVSGPDSFFCTCADEFKGDTCEKRLPCPAGKKTDNPHGRCCVFPFVYGGKTYESCTKVAHHRLWCSLDKVYKGHWANCAVEWKSEGCYKEHKRAKKMVLEFKFATVQRKKRKIREVFDICKVAAEKKGYKIFGIRNMNRCFTTSDGEVHDFKKYGVSSNCKVDYNGLGVGKKLANFVYTRL